MARRSLVAAGVVILSVLAVLAVLRGARIFLIAFAGVLLAEFWRGLAQLLKKHTPLSDRASVAVVVLAWCAVFIVGGWLLFPHVMGQVDQLAKNIAQPLTHAEQWLRQYEWGRQLLGTAPPVEQLLSSAERWVPPLSQALSSFVSVLVAGLVILVVGLYLAFEPRPYMGGIIRLVPIAKRDRAREVLLQVAHALRWWLFGRISAMLVIGILTTVGLWLLGIPLAISLGIIAALLSFIPNVGPVVSAVPAILVGFSKSPMHAVYVVLLYMGAQTLESYLITPLIQRKAVSLPPALLITFQIFMGLMAGTLGLLLATPLLVVLIVLVQMLYVRGALGDRITVLGERR